jgi:dihydroceramidase
VRLPLTLKEDAYSRTVDEVSMLYATAAILYAAISISKKGKAKTFAAVLLLVMVVLVSVLHCYLGHVKFFRRCFLGMVVSTFVQCIFVISTKVSDAEVKKDAQKLVVYGSGKSQSSS